jgi:long-chain acyl-CoA synthetase
MKIPPIAPEDGWPWAKVYAEGMSPESEPDLFMIDKVPDNGAEKWPDRAAINFRGRDISFTELLGLTNGMALRLLEEGMAAGDRIALLLPNTPAHPVSFFGALKAGAIVVHLSPLDAPPVLVHKLTDSGARVLVTTNYDAMALGAAQLLSAGVIDKLIVIDDKSWGYSAETGPMPSGEAVTVIENIDLAANSPPRNPGALDDVVLLQYTGGTTGVPKAAMLSHRNLSASMSSYKTWYEGWKLETGEAENVLLYLPLFHIYGLSTVMLRSLAAGNRLLLRTRFDPVSALDEIEGGVTIFPGVPTMWIAICATPGFENRDLSSLRIAASGGAPMPVEIARKFSGKTGIELLGGWGMSETSPAGTNLPRGWPGKNGSIGVPLPGVFMKIVELDDPNHELEDEQIGELAVCGHNVTSGYWNRPEETAKNFVDDWFLTGDIGYRDEDGFFFIVDRKKDMILCGGFNVYPQMIEQAIYEHPDVEEVLVIGIPDSYRGESPKAFVKLKNRASELTLESLRKFLADRLGPHEMPRELELRESLPRTPVGKLSKIDLKRDEIEKRAASMTG